MESKAFAYTNGALGYIGKLGLRSKLRPRYPTDNNHLATQKGIGKHMWAPGVDPVAVTKVSRCYFAF